MISIALMWEGELILCFQGKGPIIAQVLGHEKCAWSIIFFGA